MNSISNAALSVLAKTAVCICTCDRPEGLRQALIHIDRLRFSPSFVVVVDNHIAGEGLSVCSEVLESLKSPLYSYHELVPGIASARNRAIVEARSLGAEYVAFLDDDEWPSADWLYDLADEQVRTSADVVGGPVHPVFAESPTEWAINSGFYDQRFPLHNGEVHVNSTANVLIRLSSLEGFGATPFDPEFGLSGGSDHILFTTMKLQGASMAWAQSALVFEDVPASRLRWEWVKQRSFRNGNTNARAQRRFEPGLITALQRFVRTCIMFPLAIVEIAFCRSLGLGAHRGEIRLQKAMGRFAHYFGAKHNEYGARHAKPKISREA